jgi:hypothetical protein
MVNLHQNLMMSKEIIEASERKRIVSIESNDKD